MKSMKLVLPVVLLLVILTQCDSTSPDVAQSEPELLTQLTSPANSSVAQSIDAELEWNRIKGAQTYQLMISTSKTFDVALIDTTVPGTSLKARSLSPNTTYYWKVFPIKNRNSGPWSEVWSFTTDGDESAPTADMTLLTPENNADKVSSILEFTWNELQNTSEYVYQLSDNSTFNSLILEANVKGTSYIPEVLVYQKKYFWRVKGAGDGNDWSEVWTFTTGTEENDEEIISTVTLLSPVHNADKVSTNLEFTWEALSGVSEYEYQLSDNSTFSSILQKETVEGTSYIPDGLVHQKRYHWRVKAAGDGNDWSEVWTFTTGTEENDEEIISTVTLLSPVHNADKVSTNLEFTWEALSGVSEYEYQLSDNSTFSSVLQQETVEGTSYSPDGLVHQKKYHWRVKAAGDGNEWSEVWTFTTGIQSDDEITSVVTLLSPDDNADKVSTNLEFTWKALSGVSQYEYQLSDNSSFSSVLQKETVAGTSYSPNGLVHQKRYHWRVKVAGDGNDWSEVWTFTTGIQSDDDDTSTPVTLLSPQNYSSDVSPNVEFSWNEVSGISQYQFQLSENSSFSSIADEEIVLGTTYKTDVLTYEKTYFWRVKTDVAGSTWSDVYSFETETEAYTPPPPPPPSSGSFVSTHNSNFVLNGEILRFAGTNAYYLPNYEKLNSGVVDRALDLFQDTGVTVVRMWGFYDGYDCGYSKNDSSENVIQTSPGVYSESALRDLDRVIAKGKDRGIKFIIPFVNYWDELGGICQYNTWAGASNPSTNMDFFISNSQTQKWFKDYISMLLNRVNTVTGVAYKDEPAIFAWQIMNEGRNRGQHHNVLRNWYQEIAQHIKSIDKNHLVSTGEEGFDEGTPSQYSVDQYSNTYVLRANEGTSYIANTSIPEIDFGSAHWYPGEFGFGSTVNDNLLRAQRAWLSDHQKIAQNAGKPFYIGEFG
ncbi:MAG: hypothetical protein JJU13_16835, partial [Balneolaceae bacterium]|nr:hypothetical protein [Balneolaceae bacterium]